MQSLDLVPDHVHVLPKQLLEAIKLPVHSLPPALGPIPSSIVYLLNLALVECPHEDVEARVLPDDLVGVLVHVESVHEDQGRIGS